MWCLVLTSPCCCGPCETRITTGAKIVFVSNIVLWSCLLVFSILPLMSVHVAVFCGFMACTNLCALTGLRKQSGFLPVPDTWRSRIRLRDRHQYCLLLPWIGVHGLLTLIWSLLLVPVLVLASSKLYNVGADPVTIILLSVFLVLSILPYQMAVVVRCTRVVKKGGQHYIAPEPESRLPWAVQAPSPILGLRSNGHMQAEPPHPNVPTGEKSDFEKSEKSYFEKENLGKPASPVDTASLNTLSTQGSQSTV